MNHSSCRRLLRADGVSASLFALAALAVCAALPAQQPFQLPAALPGSLAGLSAPIGMVGATVLARRLPPTDAIGTWSSEANQGPVLFSPFVTGPTAAAITDPHLERGVAVATRFFCTEGSSTARSLREYTAFGGATVGPLLAG